MVPKSKTDQSGAGSMRYISDTTLNYVSDYIEEANIDKNSKIAKEKPKDDPTRINKGILFRGISPKGTTMLKYDESITKLSKMQKLDYRNIYRAIQRIANKAGLEFSISGHSQRVGAAVTMKENGYSLEEIKKAGGWKDLKMPERYTEQAVTESGMSKLAKQVNR